jgi:hypothetical protein
LQVDVSLTIFPNGAKIVWDQGQQLLQHPVGSDWCLEFFGDMKHVVVPSCKPASHLQVADSGSSLFRAKRGDLNLKGLSIYQTFVACWDQMHWMRSLSF